MPRGGKRERAGRSGPYKHLPNSVSAFRLTDELLGGLEAYVQNRNEALEEINKHRDKDEQFKPVSINNVVEGALREFLHRYSDDSTDWLSPEREYWLERYMRDEPEYNRPFVKEKVDKLLEPR
jgi:hypothetical protein